MGLASTERSPQISHCDTGPPTRERDADAAQCDQDAASGVAFTTPKAPIAKTMAWGWLAGLKELTTRARRASAPHWPPGSAQPSLDIEAGDVAPAPRGWPASNARRSSACDPATAAAAAAAAAAAGVRSSVLRIPPRHPAAGETPATEGPHSDDRVLRRARQAARAAPPLQHPAAAPSALRAPSLAPAHCRRSGLEPREDPPEGLLYLAPSARSAMWCAQRGATWALSQYSLTRQIYAGYNASVWQATCRTSGTAVVLKCYALATLSDYLRHQALRELDIHSRLRHPDMVQLLAAFRDGDELVLVMEWVRGGSLERARRKLGGRMSEQQALHLVVLPLLRALGHLHERGIVHRDLKPDNVLFSSDWRLKLCDFGVALATLEERAVTRAGTVPYLAPEVQACPLKDAPADNKLCDELSYGTAADVWSLGVLVYETLVGFAPFPCGPADGSAAPAPAAPAAVQPRSLPYPSSVSARARDFIGACLERLPGDRPTVQQLLQMEWLQSAHQHSCDDKTPVAPEEP